MSSASSSPAGLPTFFGPEERRSFGWLHLPAAGRARGLGVVVCPPFGYEAMCTHRSLRHLAEALCARGLPVLRLDYPGTGDSPGSAGHTGQVASWLAGIGDAAEELRRASGVGAVCLFGLRLGATLACAAAASSAAAALVLWAPYRSGKQFLREVRAFQSLKGAAEEATQLEVAGYPIDPGTAADLGALDLLSSGQQPAARALLLDRDDLAADPKLAAHLEGLGVRVEVRAVPGYAAMMRDANFAEVPQAVIASVAAWLEPLAGALPGPAAAPSQPPVSRAARLLQDGRELVETPLWFGGRRPLFGVVTTPAPGGPSAMPPLLFLNVGANHHVGPNRLWVALARKLAARGHRVVRFDIAGIGDSPAAPGQPDNRLYSLDSVADVREAITLALDGAGPAAGAGLIGLCSGAFLAFHAAAEDPRVAAMALLNQQTYFWREGQSLELVMRQSVKSSRFYKRALLDPNTWKRLLRNQLDLRVLLGAFARRAWARAGRIFSSVRSVLGGGPWERSEVARRLKQYLVRGGRLLLLFSDTDGGLDIMEEHLGADAGKLARHRGLASVIIEGADHTFTPVKSQAELERRLVSWVETLR